MFRHHLCDGLPDIICGCGWNPELQPHLARSAALVTLTLLAVLGWGHR
jgi:hypothetical protein